MDLQIKFWGALEDVTGSMTLLTIPKGKILIDSGLYQGTDEIVARNKEKLPFDPREINAIILTHAHLDHSGFIPRLIKLGFRGEIFCTKPTAKLARLIMSDSAKLMESEVHSLHAFYSREEVQVVASLLKIKKYHTPFKVLDIEAEFQSAGHILGAASVILKAGKTLVFSGDLGRLDDPIVTSPDSCPADADIVLLESTYGGKIRQAKLQNDLEIFLNMVKHDSKVGIIASFAVARAQMLITLIHRYYNEHPEERVRVVVDGPMMVEANNIYKEFSADTRADSEVKSALSEVEIISQERQWNSIRKKEGPLIIIASSGMVTGGRIWRYLENWQQDESACLFLPGYLGAGTPGRLLAEGEKIIEDKEGKKLHWHGEVRTSEAFSSHADQKELIYWLRNVRLDAQIFLNHGEEEAKLSLQKALVKIGYRNVEIADKKLELSLY